MGSLQDALQACGTRIFMGKFSFLMGTGSAMRKSCKNVHEAIDNLAEDALQHRKDGGVPGTFLNRLMESTQDRVEIRTQIFHMFLPGYDSNAMGLSQMFFQLARNPQVWSKLREEVLALQTSQILTFQDVRALKYHKCVVSECKASLTIRSPLRSLLLMLISLQTSDSSRRSA